MQFIIYRFRGMKNRNSKEQKKEKKKNCDFNENGET